MKILFRADASHRIGSGHVMRCLTLARLLKQRGDKIFFFSRPHTGHLNNLILQAGITLLEPGNSHNKAVKINPGGGGATGYADWLGVPQSVDASDTTTAMRDYTPVDWIIVDHYSLDMEWERAMRPCAGRIAALDDLANRSHDTDLLIDPVAGRKAKEYRSLLPAEATVLSGPIYAPLRPQFARLREASLARRHAEDHRARRLLINMGGSDPDGATLTVLEDLANASLPGNMEIEIILGRRAAGIEAIRAAAHNLTCRTEVIHGTEDMAERMYEADIAVGAAGTTSWERCCLGVPAVIITIAENQQRIAAALEQAGAIQWLGNLEEVRRSPECIGRAVAELVADRRRLTAMTSAASMLCDGQGAFRIAARLHNGVDNG